MSELAPLIDTTPPRAAHHISDNHYRSDRRPGGPISTVFWISMAMIAVVLAWRNLG